MCAQLNNDNANYSRQLEMASVSKWDMPNGQAITFGGVTAITAITVTTLTATTPTFSGVVTLSNTGANALAITGAPLASATSSLARIGVAIASGDATANGGTYLSINTPATGAGSVADLINLEDNGTSRVKVSSIGVVTVTRGGGNALALTGAPVNTATLSLLRLGSAVASGDTTADGGTYLSINTPTTGAGSVADLVNLQGDGTSRVKVSSIGVVTLARTAGNVLALTGQPVNTATLSLLRCGDAIASGDTTANGGTVFGINLPSTGAGSVADYVNWQSNGTFKFKVTSAGNTSIVGTAAITGLATLTAGASMNSATGTGTMINHVQVSLTSAQILAMNTAIELIAAPGASKTIVVKQVVFHMDRTATAYANGGAVTIGYDAATVQALDSTIASTVVTGAQGNVCSFRNPAVISDAATTINKNLAIINATAAFITGTGTAKVDIWYTVVATV